LLDITGVGVDSIDVAGAARRIASLAREGAARLSGDGFRAAYVCTPNAEHMMDAQKDRHFKRILNEADLVVPDGSGVVLAARLLGYGRIPRTPGFDLAYALVSNQDEYPFSFYFFGGRPGVAEKAAENILREHPRVRIAGCRDGYFNESDEPDIIEKINGSGADLLYVALGAPKQEKWIYRNRAKIKVPVCMGVGGTIDALAGTVRLAPPFFRERGLEWLYRLAREPWRAKRMLKLPQYTLYAIWWRFFGRRKNG